jgi:hypothetical protein
MNKKISIPIFSILVFFGTAFFSCASAALEVTYPPIGSYKLTATSTLVQFVEYFFALALLLGGSIAVVMVIYAGVGLLMSQGEPGKVNESKSRMKNALIGLVVLFGTYLIINTLNSGIFSIKNIETECLSGIDITVSGGANSVTARHYCIQDSVSSIDLTNITGTTWKFDATAYPLAYAYDQEKYQGNISEVKNGGSFPSSTKSIYLMSGQEGVYLYDSTGYKPKDRSYPLVTTSSISDLTSKSDAAGRNYNYIIKSVKIVEPSSGRDFYDVILFSKPAFAGTCSYTLRSVTDLGSAGSDIYSNNPPFGQNNASSVVVFKASSINASKGTVVFYNAIACPDSSSDPEVKRCTISIPNQATIANISDACPDFKGYVQSMSINGPGGVVLKTGTTSNATPICELWTQPSNTNCVGTIIDSDVYKGNSNTSSSRPGSFIIFPIQ